jgi:hypothetical protein
MRCVAAFGGGFEVKESNKGAGGPGAVSRPGRTNIRRRGATPPSRRQALRAASLRSAPSGDCAPSARPVGDRDLLLRGAAEIGRAAQQKVTVANGRGRARGSMFAERLLARRDSRRRLDIDARARPWQHGRPPICQSYGASAVDPRLSRRRPCLSGTLRRWSPAGPVAEPPSSACPALQFDGGRLGAPNVCKENSEKVLPKFRMIGYIAGSSPYRSPAMFETAVPRRRSPPASARSSVNPAGVASWSARRADGDAPNRPPGSTNACGAVEDEGRAAAARRRAPARASFWPQPFEFPRRAEK